MRPGRSLIFSIALLMHTFIRNECRDIQNQVEHKAMPTLNTELTKNYNAMQSLL